MRDNLYTRTIDKMKISDRAVDKAVLLVEEQKGLKKVIDMKEYTNKRSRKVKITAASLAAVVAISGGVYALINSSASDDIRKNGFVLTAGAAEISDNEFKTISRLESTYAFKHSIDSYSEIFNLVIKCEGKNIDSITYTAKGNAHFNLQDDYIEQFESIADNSEENKYTLGDKICREFTVAYDNQVTAIEPDYNVVNYPVYTPVCVELTLNENDSDEIKNALKNNFYYSMYYHEVNPEYDEKIKSLFAEAEEYGFNYETLNVDKMYETIYDNLFERASVETTVNYSDGTKETRTIIFSYDNASFDGDCAFMDITAKIK